MKRILEDRWKVVIAMSAAMLLASETAQAVAVDFADLSLSPESQWNGTDTTYNDGSGDSNPFVSGGVTFSNYHEYSDPWGSGPTHYWDGWAYSNRTDVASTKVAGQYTAVANPVGGLNDSNYAMGYFGWAGRVPTITFAAPCRVESACFTNNAYAYDSMLNGDSFAKKFGGTTGNDSDWFKLTIIGKNADGAATGTVDFFLANYQFSDNSQDYIIHNWTSVDLTGLGDHVASLTFALDSSDHSYDPGTGGDWGMNTPAYFAMDNLTTTPEPSTITLAIIGLLACWGWRRRRTVS
jgi:hypothetical protein